MVKEVVVVENVVEVVMEEVVMEEVVMEVVVMENRTVSTHGSLLCSGSAAAAVEVHLEMEVDWGDWER